MSREQSAEACPQYGIKTSMIVDNSVLYVGLHAYLKFVRGRGSAASSIYILPANVRLIVTTDHGRNANWYRLTLNGKTNDDDT